MYACDDEIVSTVAYIYATTAAVADTGVGTLHSGFGLSVNDRAEETDGQKKTTTGGPAKNDARLSSKPPADAPARRRRNNLLGGKALDWWKMENGTMVRIDRLT